MPSRNAVTFSGKRIATVLGTLNVAFHSRIICAKLKPLEGVRQSDGEDWAVQHASKFVQGVDLTPRIRELFQKWEKSGAGDAVNVALILGRPLLVNGEPGAGKTHLAFSVAWELGLGEPLKFEPKSTSSARDLFYTYDVLGRFHASQFKEDTSPARYLTYNALGLAIIRAVNEESAIDQLPKAFGHGGKRRSLALIDEIDKAPRDFPNDILNEIEDMYFRVPEMNNINFRADPALRPVVIITSNSEKGLPDAFLRRCIYCYIEFPSRERLIDIVKTRLVEYVKPGDALFATIKRAYFVIALAPNSTP